MKPQCPEGRRLRREAGLWLHLVTDRPQEGSDLTGDRRRGDCGLVPLAIRRRHRAHSRT